MKDRFALTAIIKQQRAAVNRARVKVHGLRDEISQALAPEIVAELQLAGEALTAAESHLLVAQTHIEDLRKHWRAKAS